MLVQSPDCRPAARGLRSGSGIQGWRGIMTFALRFALGAGGALLAAAALAQTQPPPAPAPAPAPAAAPAPASPYAPTATLNSGYPGTGPADDKLRSLAQPNGKKLWVLPATLETTQ